MLNGEAYRAAVARALRFIDAQEAFRVHGHPAPSEGGGVCVEISVKPDLYFSWQSKGRSPNGVLIEEPVLLDFPPAYPLKAPRIHLREGFDCSLAHVTPGAPGQRGEPCLVDGNLDEFHQREGMSGILRQLKLWLENAAFGTLMNPAHGWEPTWRNSCADLLIADATFLRELVTKEPQGGTAWFRLDYFEIEERRESRPPRHIEAQLRRDRLSLNTRTLPGLLEKSLLRRTPSIQIHAGHSLGLFVWPSERNHGQPVIAVRYAPETVVNHAGLMEKAKEFECVDRLRDAFNWFERLLSHASYGGPWPLVVVLCARRPFNLIRSDNALELCPYVFDIRAPKVFPKKNDTRVRPTGHRHMISGELLQRMSGLQRQDVERKWVQLGCGSLGSKVAVHLSRAGWAPIAVVDSGSLSPHNAARHALLPNAWNGDLLWAGPKASALADALKGLGSEPVPHVHDVAADIHDPLVRARLLPPESWVAVNSTASLCVREALGAIPIEDGSPRIIETSLFADGQIGVLTVEGPGRTPNTLDLQAHLYDLARAEPDLQKRFFAQGPATGRQVIGEGCGSETMVMSDARISMFAASMSEAILAYRTNDLPPAGGRILIGALGEDGISLRWQSREVPPPMVVHPDYESGWTVRISNQADELIRADVSRWPSVETGGILVGRHSEAARAFYVTGILPAPADSTRSPAEFVLGIKGLEAALDAFTESCGEGLYFLGTWHSHLRSSGPSGLDRKTAQRLAETRLVPSVMLIHTPTGYRVLLADSAILG